MSDDYARFVDAAAYDAWAGQVDFQLGYPNQYADTYSPGVAHPTTDEVVAKIDDRVSHVGLDKITRAQAEEAGFFPDEIEDDLQEKKIERWEALYEARCQYLNGGVSGQFDVLAMDALESLHNDSVTLYCLRVFAQAVCAAGGIDLQTVLDSCPFLDGDELPSTQALENLGWLNDLLTDYATRRQAINTAQSLEAVLAVSLDFTYDTVKQQARPDIPHDEWTIAGLNAAIIAKITGT